MEPLESLCLDYQDSKEALVFSPRPGNLLTIIKFLVELEINYQLDFKTED